MVIRYIDFNRGNDANDGLSTAAPWKTLSKLPTVSAVAGDRFLLASDSVFEADIATTIYLPGTWTGIKEGPVVIGRYGASAATDLPTISWRRNLAPGDWTYDGANNCWYHDCGVQLGSLAYVRFGTGAVWNAGTASTTTLPLASVDGLYRLSGSTLYVYAPAGIDPTNYYGRVHLAPNQTGYLRVEQNSGFVRFEDVLFKDGGSAVSIYSNNTTYFGVELRDCKMQGGNACLSITTSPADTNMDVVVNGLDASGFGTCAIWAYGSGSGTLRSLEIKNSHFSDGPNGSKQGQVYLQAKPRSCAIHHNHFEASHYGSYSTPIDGCALYSENISDGITVYANTFNNHVRALQLNSGRTGTVRSNLFYNCRQPIQLSDASGNNASVYVVEGNTIIGGAAINPEYGSIDTPGIGIDAYFGGGNTGASLTVRNNIIVNSGGVVPQYSSAVLCHGLMTLDKYTLNISDNLMHGFTNMASFVTAGIETVISTVRPISGDPLLDSDYKPREGSPAIRAGQHLGYSLDMAGMQRWNPPSIGAFEAEAEL